VEVEDLVIDDRNEEKFARHGVTAREVRQVVEEENLRVFRNKKTDDNAPYILVGKTRGGRLLTVAIDPTENPGVWRPRTAWDSSESERTRYEH
jgi:uncharacterized DUF497 family protein